MVDYTKLKNAELETLLKERGLPHTGKKADMVSRLTDDDAKKTAVSGANENEDEIDWDDDAADVLAPVSTEPEKPAQVAAATETSVEGNNPQAVPNQAASIDPANTDDLTAKAPAADANSSTVKASENGSVPPEKSVPDFAAGLASTNLDKELEARKKRAERFGIKEEDPAAVEAAQKLKRAQKFGTTETTSEAPAVKGLDVALPDRPIKRRRDGGDDRGDYKRGGRGGGGRRFNDRGGRGPRDNGGRRGPRNDRGSREPRRENNGDRSGWMSEADRKRAAERTERFTNKV